MEREFRTMVIITLTSEEQAILDRLYKDKTKKKHIIHSIQELEIEINCLTKNQGAVPQGDVETFSSLVNKLKNLQLEWTIKNLQESK